MPEKPMETMETRTVTAQVELRGDSSAPVLEGYASVFNTPYDLGLFREQVSSKAFARSLGTNPDVRLLIDHEGQPLARTKSGTLDLDDKNEIGLRVRATLDPSDPDVQRLLPKMRRGDLDQMSFAFRVPNGGDSWDDDYGLRTLNNVEINGGDVSVVTYPASPSTSAGIRALDEIGNRYMLARRILADAERAGKVLSSASEDKLLQALQLVHKADMAVDAAQPLLASVLGVPNPDTDPVDSGTAKNSLPNDLARRLAVALAR